MPFYYYYPFGENADDLPAPIPVETDPSGAVSYYQGWTPPYEANLLTDPAALPIPRDQMNQLFYDITFNLQQYQQYGTPNFITTSDNQGTPFPYPIYARVYYLGEVWENQEAANTTLPGVDESWSKISGSFTGVRPGTIIDFAGVVTPTAYLDCDGAAVSRTTYADLFSALTHVQNVTTTVSATVTGLTNATRRMYPGMHIESPNFAAGTTIASITNDTTVVMSNVASAGATTIRFFNWGNGDGSTTFNTPNLLYRGTMGDGGTPGTTAQAPSTGRPTGVVGTTGGESQHTQLIAEMPSHNHPGSTVGTSTNTNNGAFVQNSLTNSVANTLDIAAQGGGSAFNVIGPTALVRKCIKT